ncbi:MAG: M28 family peptidase [Verrucomicrobiota bacterium]
MRVLISLFRIFGVVAGLLFVVWVYIAQPSFRSNGASEVDVDPEKLKAHVVALSEEFHPRSFRDPENLDAAAEYIAEHFRQGGAQTSFQPVPTPRREYRNVIGVINPGAGRKLVIGAHYDAYHGTPGADDNATGVAGLIELAHLFSRSELNREVELVAYTLEEPPFFGSGLMGSHVHAENSTDVEAAIILEMIGYFDDSWGSQDYPTLILHLMYPSRGNFVVVASDLDHRSLTKDFKVGMKGATELPVYSINAPSSLPGIDFSDHRNYWKFDIPAVMITDTAFYRNKQYHQIRDNAKRLDYDRMAMVVIGVYEAVMQLD